LGFGFSKDIAPVFTVQLQMRGAGGELNWFLSKGIIIN
jgi:hypothetical protein